MACDETSEGLVRIDNGVIVAKPNGEVVEQEEPNESDSWKLQAAMATSQRAEEAEVCSYMESSKLNETSDFKPTSTPASSTETPTSTSTVYDALSMMTKKVSVKYTDLLWVFLNCHVVKKILL